MSVSRIFGSILILLLISPIQNVTAQEFDSALQSASYRSLLKVDKVEVVVPTVVEVSLEKQKLERSEFMVVESETGKFVPSYYKEKYKVQPVAVSVKTTGGDNPAALMLDNNYHTGVLYRLNESYVGETEVMLTAVESIKVSGLSLSLEQNVSLPTSVEVLSVDESGTENIVLAKSRMTNSRINFIPTVANNWIVKFTYAQPLQINELSLIQDDIEQGVERSLRFLAQPGMSYVIYQNPDHSVKMPRVESGDLSDDKDVLLLPKVVSEVNPDFKPIDTDSDGIPDILDNCVAHSNPDQTDIDNNGRGDVCDDWDRDGVLNSVDNCINTPNASRLDSDGDGVGDACDDEESRFTEKYKWIPWVGIGLALGVIIGLFVVVARRPLNAGEGKVKDDN